MNEDFQKRLARLEAKNGPETLPPSAPAPEQKNVKSARNGDKRGHGALIQMVVIGAVCLIALPTAAVFISLKMPQVREASDRVAAYSDFMQATAGYDSPEKRSAQKEIDNLVIRMSTGQMSMSEQEYWASPEGEKRLADLKFEASRVDFEKAVEAAKRIQGVN
jgi:hypothetical protein